MRPVRVLGIAPYEGMRSLMLRVAETFFPEISINVVIGDLQKGVEIAQKNFHANYDVIVSRGGTANLIRDCVSIPVIEIAISEFDLMRTMHLAKSVSKKCAIVGFLNVTKNAHTLSELASIQLEPFTIRHEDEVESVLIKTASSGFDTIICDTIAYATARKLGINAILITSSQESIQKALHDVVFLCASMDRLRQDNLFLRELLNTQSNDTVVFDEANALFFSTLEYEANSDVIHLLESEIPHCSGTSPTRIIKSLNGSLYTIKALRLINKEKAFTAFYINRSRNPIPAKRYGINYRTCAEAMRMLEDSFYYITHSFPKLDAGISLPAYSSCPIAILGEYGVEKDYVATYIYTQSAMKTHPLIDINCSLLNEKSWGFLLSSHNSPFTQSGNTIYLSHMSSLSADESKLLLGALSTMDVFKRNLVILSFTSKYGESISEAATEYINHFQAKRLILPPLRTQSKMIPAMVSLYFNRLNLSQPQELIGMEPEAFKLMENFSWPHNHAQLRRVLLELSANATKSVISAQAVKQILSLESSALVVAHRGDEDRNNRFDLNRTLDKMTKEIVQRVVDEHDGNQTAAAKQLGISRTTMWRLLKE